MKSNRINKRTEYLFKTVRCYLSSDARYKKNKFYQSFGREPDLASPETFNEKVLCRMLNDRNVTYTLLADKICSRRFIETTLGGEYVVPLLGIYDRFDDIDPAQLPDKFVLKCNHDSGSTLICQDKSAFDWQAARRHFAFCLSRNMYVITRERHYRQIVPKIVCEAWVDLYQGHDKNITPEMFRIHCFDGNPVISEVDFTDENGQEKTNLYDMLWNRLEVQVGAPGQLQEGVKRPEALTRVMAYSQRLCLNFDYCRLDWYICGERILFSEFTFTPCAGKMAFSPAEFDAEMGAYWQQAPSLALSGSPFVREIKALVNFLASPGLHLSAAPANKRA